MDNAPKLPTIWLMPLSNAPQCPGFQESERKTVNVSLDFENQNYKCYYFVSKTDMDIVIILIPL
jgi:hypothetical protein